MNAISLLILVVGMGGMMYYMSRNQKKQQEARLSLLNNMQVGDKVITIGGLHGIVAEMNRTSNTVYIDCEGVQLEFERDAIRTVKPSQPVVTEEAAKKEETVIEEETITSNDESSSANEVEPKESDKE